MKKLFRKLYYTIPLLVWTILICGAAKDVHNSFTRLYIVLAVEDTASLNATYEKPIYRMLKVAGHTVRLAYGDSLVSDNAIGTQDWNTFDLAIIPNFVSVPSVDTSKDIGATPVIILEDSLWDDFGFIPAGASEEPYLWIADYQNGRIVKTQWDGTGWSSFSTVGGRLPRSISLYRDSGGDVDTSLYYITHYRSGTACDTIFRTNWNYGSYTTFGSTGAGDFQFNRPEQIFSAYFGGDAIYAADRVNNRMVRAVWQTSSAGQWVDYVTGGVVYGAASLLGVDACFDVWAGNSKVYKNWLTGVPDSLALGEAVAGHIWPTRQYLYVANGAAFGSGKIWKIDNTTLAVSDSLTADAIGSPFGVWFDTTSSYIYWTDQNGSELKRAKFDGTSNGALLDSCFGVGSGANQLSAPKGLEGLSISSLAPSISNEDSIYINFVTDSITVVFAKDYKKIYTAASYIKGIDTTGFYRSNILAKDEAQEYGVVVIDTINSVKRIAFGLQDVSNLNFVDYANSHPTENKSYPAGWELFNRCLGRLKGSEQDSIFSVVYLVDNSYMANSWDTTSMAFLQTNMQRLDLSVLNFGDDGFYSIDSVGWNIPDLVMLGYQAGGVSNFDSLIFYRSTYNKPILSVTSNMISEDFFSITRRLVDSDSIIVAYVDNEHPITDSLSYSDGDTIKIFSTMPDATGNYFWDFQIDDSDITMSIAKAIVGSTSTGRDTANIMLARKDKYWVAINLGVGTDYVSKYIYDDYYDDNYWDLFKESLYYVLSGQAVLPPSGVTVTQYPNVTDSLIVSWTDNSSNETGFSIYLVNGGSYTGSDILIKTTAADITCDTVGVFWPPSGVFYLDVASVSNIGGGRSGSPDSAFTYPASTAKPIVYALSDTAINVITNGYRVYDLFTDTTLTVSPTWYRPYGTWNVERSYNRLRTYDVLDSASLEFSPDTQVLKFDSTGSAILTETAGSLDNTLDVDKDDFMISLWAMSERVGKNNYLMVKSSGYYLKFDASTIAFFLFNGASAIQYINVGISQKVWYHIVVVVDRSGYAYCFVDNEYADDGNISAISSVDLDNVANFQVAKSAGGELLKGKMMDARFYRFGYNGLTTTGTYATNNLLIKLGTDTLYCQANSGAGLIKDLYDNPRSSISDLGYSYLYDAERTSLFTNGESWTDTNSDGLANNMNKAGSPTLEIGDGTHGFSGKYQRMVYTASSGQSLFVQGGLSLADSAYYEIRCDYRATKAFVLGPGGYQSTNAINTGAPVTAYTVAKAPFLSNAVYTNLSTYVSGDSVEIDNLYIRKVGEVAWWKLDETGIPTTLTDQSSNNLDLTTSGSPITVPISQNVTSTFINADKNYIHFDGVNDYGYKTDDDDLDVLDHDYAYSVWFYRNRVNRGESIFSKRSTATYYNQHEISFVAGDNKIYAGLGAKSGVAAVESNTNTSAGRWYHYFYVADRDGNGYVFLNNLYERAESISARDSIQNNTVTAKVGVDAFYTTYFFSGMLSDFRFFKFGLDGLTVTGTYAGGDLLIKSGSDTVYDQVSGDGLMDDLYNNIGVSAASLGFTDTSEVAWWTFDTTGVRTKIYDRTANDLDLTLVNNTTVGTPYDFDYKDTEFSVKFHLNDSLRLNKEWVKFYFMSNNFKGEDDGYLVYADSSIFRVYKQTNNAYADTLIDTTYTGNYKWRTLKVTQDWTQYPTYKDIGYDVYLDNNLMGSFSDTTYQTSDWLVLKGSHRRQWYDNFWVKNTTPGANDSTYTEFCIEDSTSGTYLQNDHTFGASPVWNTYEDWGGADGFYGKMSAYTSKTIRIRARNKR